MEGCPVEAIGSDGITDLHERSVLVNEALGVRQDCLVVLCIDLFANG